MAAVGLGAGQEVLPTRLMQTGLGGREPEGMGSGWSLERHSKSGRMPGEMVGVMGSESVWCEGLRKVQPSKCPALVRPLIPLHLTCGVDGLHEDLWWEA